MRRNIRHASRSPHGERGLKSVRSTSARPKPTSLSSWRAWIEIPTIPWGSGRCTSLSSWRAWIEIRRSRLGRTVRASLSSWRAWIEIRTGSCGRSGRWSLSSWRAWIEISVNSSFGFQISRSPHGERGLKSCTIRATNRDIRSLSSWRAWIEMSRTAGSAHRPPVALLLESVD